MKLAIGGDKAIHRKVIASILGGLLAVYGLLFTAVNAPAVLGWILGIGFLGFTSVITYKNLYEMFEGQ